jgi:hypothetical protein
VVTSGCRENVAAGGADAEDADAVRVDLRQGGEVGDSCFEVLNPVRGVFEAAGVAAALPLVSSVEGEGDEALFGEPARVESGGLLLDTAARMPDDNARTRAARGTAGGVEVAGQGDPCAIEGDVGLCHDVVAAIPSGSDWS